MPNLNLFSNIVAYSDAAQTNNPSLKNFDWSRQLQGIAVRNPKSQSFSVDPGATLTVFDGTRSTSIDSSTEFVLSQPDGYTNRYRMAWDSTGTDPAFRTDRAIDCSTHTITVEINANGTATFTSNTAGDFASVQVGDVVFIPGTSTGDDAGDFNANNEGEWTVLAKDNTDAILTLARPTGITFSAYGEVVTVTAPEKFMAYTAAGVQAGDKVTISAGFEGPLLTTFTVAHVRPTLFEFYATQALPTDATAVPDATGMVFYTAGKIYVRIESDQECLVQANGSSDTTQRMSPWAAGDPALAAEYTKTGPMWSLDITNLSAVQMNVVLISVE